MLCHRPTSSRSTRTPRPTVAAGFTLIELLTVIAIIGILASILIPVVGKVREAARNTVCMSNVRQWGQAVILYAEDNDGYYAVRDDWDGEEGVSNWYSTTSAYNRYVDLGEAVRDFRHCPADRSSEQGTALSYALNHPTVAGKLPARDRIPLGKSDDLTGLLLIVDVDGRDDGDYFIDGSANYRRGAPAVIRLFNAPLKDERHVGKVNAVFADGHVEAVHWYQRFDNDPKSFAAQWDRWTSID